MLLATALAAAVIPPVAVALPQATAPRPGPAEVKLWSPMAEDALGLPDRTRRIEGRDHRVLRLDHRILADLLARAPKEGSGTLHSDLVLELPWPDGSFRTFRIAETSVAEPGLKARCPDVKTYRGRGTDDTSYAHFEWSPPGLRAVIQANGVEAHIAPYAPGNSQDHIVYYVRDWRPAPEEPASGASATGRVAPAPSTAVPPASPPAAASIEEITIERRCFRCENQYKLTLHGDGTATLMRMGVLAFGTLDHECRGGVDPVAYAALATFIKSSGFFDLEETYRDPGSAEDGAVITSVLAAGGRKVVVNRGGKARPSLTAIEEAVEDLGEKVRWEAGR